MNVKKQAAADAYEYALAELFFGEGAGTRRKLINNKVAWNTERISGYKEAFDSAYSKLDFGVLTDVAIQQRKRIDRMTSASKNVKALARGDLRGASTAVVIVGGAAWVAHQTGYDKVLLGKAKQKYADLKHDKRSRHLRREMKKRWGV